MDSRPTTHLPTISISSGPPILLRLGWHVRIAERAGVSYANLDLGSRFAQSLLTPELVVPGVVTAIWLGQPWTSIWTGAQDQARMLELVRGLDPLSLVVDLDSESNRIISAGALVKRVEQSRRLFGRDVRLLIAIRGHKLAGGRQHLAELTALRHLAEEWDLGVALDLAGKFDPTWEAEAAVLRLGNQLKLIRMPTTAMDRLAVGRDRVCNRALAAAVDQGFPPEIALVPSVPWYQAGSIQARAESVARAATAIANRVVSVKSQRARFLGQDLWPNLRG